MKRTCSQKGFTLVELAIVMTIIGLLIGGILKGQELIMNARVTATVAQVKGYTAAMTTFKDMYQATPGDMPNAGTRLVGCPTAAACTPLAANAGDNIVGSPTWASGGWAAYGATATATTPGNVDDERYLFWTHLLLANLIAGITTDGLSVATNLAWDVTNPSAKLGGGFVAGYDTGAIAPGSPAPAGTGLTGTIVVEVPSPTTGFGTMTTTASGALSPLRAAQVDRKMDDGRPTTGIVQAAGVAANCFGAAAPFLYNETVSTTDCNLMYRIEN